MEQTEIKSIVKKVMDRMSGEGESDAFPVEMSARHVHLCTEHVEKLFGKGAKLTVKRMLSLPGGFLSEQRVTLVTEKGVFKNVAVLGPERSATQVELSAADAYQLGIKAPCNISGDLTGAGDVYIFGPCGVVHATGSCIIAQAHVHMNEAEAAHYGVADGEIVAVDILSDRHITFQNVKIRVGKDMHATMHIDMDEANACHQTDDVKGVLRKLVKG